MILGFWASLGLSRIGFFRFRENGLGQGVDWAKVMGRRPGEQAFEFFGKFGFDGF